MRKILLGLLSTILLVFPAYSAPTTVTLNGLIQSFGVIWAGAKHCSGPVARAATDSKKPKVTLEDFPIDHFAVSPDGSKIAISFRRDLAFTDASVSSQVFVVDVSKKQASLITKVGPEEKGWNAIRGVEFVGDDFVRVARGISTPKGLGHGRLPEIRTQYWIHKISTNTSIPLEEHVNFGLGMILNTEAYSNTIYLLTYLVGQGRERPEVRQAFVGFDPNVSPAAILIGGTSYPTEAKSIAEALATQASQDRRIISDGNGGIYISTSLPFEGGGYKEYNIRVNRHGISVESAQEDLVLFQRVDGAPQFYSAYTTEFVSLFNEKGVESQLWRLRNGNYLSSLTLAKGGYLARFGDFRQGVAHLRKDGNVAVLTRSDVLSAKEQKGWDYFATLRLSDQGLIRFALIRF